MTGPMDDSPSTKRPRKKKRRTFAELYGIWRGMSNLSYEEIKKAEMAINDHWLREDANQQPDETEEP